MDEELAEQRKIATTCDACGGKLDPLQAVARHSLGAPSTFVRVGGRIGVFHPDSMECRRVEHHRIAQRGPRKRETLDEIVHACDTEYHDQDDLDAARLELARLRRIEAAARSVIEHMDDSEFRHALRMALVKW